MQQTPQNNWVDSSVYHRLRHAVELLMRAKGKFAKRAYAAVQLILAIHPQQIPEELRPHLMRLTALAEQSVTYGNALYFSGMHNLSSKDRDDMVAAILALYEAAAMRRSA